MESRLGRKAWLDAGLKVLAREGVDGVRITTLATALKVTKGSFYWHFRDRAEFLDALLDSWQASGTDAVMASVEARGGDARTRLRLLFAKSLESDGRLFLAIRGWASSDRKAAALLEKVVRRRIAYVEQLFLEMGFDAPEAAARARFAFQALIGQYILGSGPMLAGKSRPADSELIFALLLSKA